MPPSDIRSMLRAILESVSILKTDIDKLDWINRGVLDLVIKVILRNGNTELYNDVPIAISKHLLDQNPEGCSIYCKNLLQLIDREPEWECVGIYSSIYQLSDLPTFRDVSRVLFNSKQLSINNSKKGFH